MAISIASSTVSNYGSAGAITIANPSGLAEGDYMLLVVGGNDDSVTPQSGWNTIFDITDTQIPRSEITASWKQATAGDISAGSVTTTSNSGTSRYAGVLFRITSTTTPVFRLAGGNSTVFSTGSLTHYVNGQPVILVATFGSTYDGSDATGSFAGYSLTSGVSNPTWTEVADTHRTSSNAATLAVATAQLDLDTTITAFGATFTGGTTAETCALISIQEPYNQTGTSALLTSTPVFFGESSVEVGGVGTNNLLEQNPVFFETKGKVIQATNWTDQEKGTATWTDQIKNI
jgi:hypothetical protein